MINDHDYWNEKFENPSLSEQRSSQTEYFARLALSYLPKWCTESISESSKSICDMGCARGDGTVLLHEAFPNCDVIGADFSETALHDAAKLHKGIQFKQSDIRSFTEQYDVIFSSNVMEHFYDTKGLLTRLLSKANQYLILLLPFREYYRIDEHAATFDFRSFPLREGKHTLSYFKIVPMSSDKDKEFWIGEQILVVYKSEHVLLPYGETLETIYNGYMEERTHIIDSYDKKLILQQTLLDEKENEINESVNVIRNKDQELQSKQAQLEIGQKELQENQRQLRFISQELQEKEERLSRVCDELVAAMKNLRSVEEECDELKQDLKQRLSQEETLHKVEQECDRLRGALEFILSRQGENKELVQQIKSAIAITQTSRSYKWSLFMRRFLNQFCRGSWAERKDFARWIWSKIIRKDNGSKWLREFDYLNNITPLLNQVYTPSFGTNGISNCTCHSRVGAKAEDLCAKTGRQIFIFASVPYYDVGGGQRSAQMARTFNDMGFRVYYIYGFESSESKQENLYIPTIKHAHIDQYSVEEMKLELENDAVLIFEIPYRKFEPYLEYACMQGCETVYEHIDNWDSSLGSMFYDEEVLKAFMKRAGAITVTARLLGEKIRNIWKRKYLYLANAVDSTLFEPAKSYQKPNDLVEGEKTLLYFGSLWGEWFDWDKILYVANNCDCEINLIGDYHMIYEKVEVMPPNIHFLGLKKQTDLPAYLYYSDIALLPFKNCEIGKYVSPLKVFEYIAMGKPVLATPLDDISGYPNVFVSDSKEEWVEAIQGEWDLQETSTFTARNNWFARCDELLSYSAKEKSRIPLISVVVLNHNNMNVIFRCVSSLLDFNKKYNCEIVVVDNDSTDGSYEELRERYGKQIVLIKNQKNGCSSGRNLGVENSSGEMIFFLDSDQWIVGENYLDNALEIMRRNDSIGAVGWNAGWFNPGRYDGPIVDFLPNRGMDMPSKLYRTDVAYLATSGMLMSKELFKKINGFDEFYDPTCFEDTDISLKIRNAGFELAYCPYMSIMHLPHQTTNSGSAKHTQLMERNGTYFLKKWNAIDASLLEYHI